MSENGNGHDNFDGWRTQPMYSFTEVAHLSHVSVSTVRNWLLGYTNEQGEVGPLFRRPPEEGKACSFLQLIEIVVAAKFRKAEHKSFKTVRLAYDNAQRLHRLAYPFASMELKAIGGHIVHIMRIPGASLQALDQPEQFTIPDLVQETLGQLEYEYELATRWYPIGKQIPIVVDPRIGAGLPTIEGSGVTIQVIRKRWKEARQTFKFIAKDFELDEDVVEKALQYAEKVAV